MSRSEPPLTPEVRALLEYERTIAPVPSSVRARAMARARAALIAGRVTAPSLRPVARRGRYWVVALAAASVASAAVGTTAYELGVHRQSVPADQMPAAVERPAALPLPPSAAPLAVPPVVPLVEPAARTEPAPAPRPSAARADESADELRLLRRARALVARQDYAGALASVEEHASRFKHGRLSEEREALRVKALAGLGRKDEARSAANRFEERFPRSVLLQSVRRMPKAP